MEMTPTDMAPGHISTERLWDIIKRCELTEADECHVQTRCREKGLTFLSTPFSREAADGLERMRVPAFKIGSGECNNLPLIEHTAALIGSGRQFDVTDLFEKLIAERKETIVFPIRGYRIDVGQIEDIGCAERGFPRDEK